MGLEEAHALPFEEGDEAFLRANAAAALANAATEYAEAAEAELYYIRELLP